MTQLIAAICEGGKNIVAVSDRMVSTADMTLTFEPDEIKAQPVGHKALVMIAGTLHEPDLIRDAREKVRGKERLREVADALKEVYQDLRDSRIEDEVLRPCTGLRTFAEYHDKQTKLHDSLIMEMNDRIRRYNLGLTLVLTGVDDQGHVFYIDNPGVWRSFDNLGYCCEGIGDRHADNVFAWYRYTQAIPLNEAIFIAFEAKKRAEMAGGVGKATDIHIIDDQGIRLMSQETVRHLEEAYDGRESRGQRRGFERNITELEVQATPVEAA